MLNSLIIEGKVANKNGDEAQILFTSYSGETYRFEFRNFGAWKKKFGVGDNVRIVGKLINDNGKVLIYTEHMEIRKNSDSHRVANI